MQKSLPGIKFYASPSHKEYVTTFQVIPTCFDIPAIIFPKFCKLTYVDYLLQKIFFK